MTNDQFPVIRKILASLMTAWLVLLAPAVALAEGESCVGFGCEQNPATSSPAPVPETEVNVIGFNANTGADSTNAIKSDVESDKTTTVNNQADDTTNATATGNTGGNTANKNSSDAAVDTGNAAIGVTSVKNDNTTVLGGQAGLDVLGHAGDYTGDYTIGFGSNTANLGGGGSYQAVNETTGAGSDNTIGFKTKVTETTEVQNDGKIDNILNLFAITGQNDASMNTGGGNITTGDADIAATLVNLLNTTVINGSLMVSVADIFGDLNGNVNLPDLNALAYALMGASPSIVAGNENTGADSTNDIDIDLKRTETTDVDNTADINTTVNADAITGQNDAGMNTGGGFVDTGDVSVSASNITLANTTVDGGNWALVIVNALNKWLGFMVGDNGEVKALSQDETIEAVNRNTGADSTNEIAILDERERATKVANNASINNEVNAEAITGQNTANYNTGAGDIKTGDANVTATAVNIANTTVKDGSLFIAVVNIMGDWFGDLFYGGESLISKADIAAANSNTGANSENTIDVNIDRSKTTDIDNEATIHTALNANVDTGNNTANKNTKGGSIETGSGVLALHARAVANLTGIAVDPALGVQISGLNDSTGFDAKNTIKATLNDERIISVDNFADISTIFASLVNTGGNEASYNTIGGHIGTGNIDASVGINNLVNQVLLALLGGSAIEVDADFKNRLTGALSENENEVEAVYEFLADITNQGLIDNLIDLILNTGGNRANANTLSLGGSIVSGSICVDGDVSNDVNGSNKLANGLFSVTAGNDADIANQANVLAETGNNEQNMNTHDGRAESRDGCKIAQKSEQPEDQDEDKEEEKDKKEEDNGGGGGDVGPDEEVAGQGGAGEEGKVAGVTEEPKPAGRVNGGQILRRFPVAGMTRSASGVRVEAYALGAAALLAGAYYMDRRARQKRTAAELKLDNLA